MHPLRSQPARKGRTLAPGVQPYYLKALTLGPGWGLD